jgi:hypothetical protein
MLFNATFNNISVISWQSGFIGGGNQSTWGKPPIWRKSLINSHNSCDVNRYTIEKWP